MAADSTTGPEGDIGKSIPASFFEEQSMYSICKACMIKYYIQINCLSATRKIDIVLHCNKMKEVYLIATSLHNFVVAVIVKFKRL